MYGKHCLYGCLLLQMVFRTLFVPKRFHSLSWVWFLAHMRIPKCIFERISQNFVCSRSHWIFPYGHLDEVQSACGYNNNNSVVVVTTTTFFNYFAKKKLQDEWKEQICQSINVRFSGFQDLAKKILQLLGTFPRMTTNRPSIKVWSGIGSNCTRWTFYKTLILWGLAWLPWFDDIAFSSLHVFRFWQNVFFNHFEVNTLLDPFSFASGELAFEEYKWQHYDIIQTVFFIYSWLHVQYH